MMLSLPYLTWAKSPTTMSATGIWMTFPFRTTVNFCSCSIRLCRPRNCFSLDQSLNAVTKTTHTTDSRMAAPSIQPVSPSASSSAPPDTFPHAAVKQMNGWLANLWSIQLETDLFTVTTWWCDWFVSFYFPIIWQMLDGNLLSKCKEMGPPPPKLQDYRHQKLQLLSGRHFEL